MAVGVARAVPEEDAGSRNWDTLFRGLQDDTLSGRYRPRERLIEDDIIARTGATRHAVRRAFDELERAGLVARPPNRGVRVRDSSAGEVQDLYEIRLSIETRAAMRFEMPADDDLLDQLTDLATRHQAA